MTVDDDDVGEVQLVSGDEAADWGLLTCTRTIDAPAFAKARAIDCPLQVMMMSIRVRRRAVGGTYIPLVPPVTKAVCPSRLKSVSR